ncbi:uncharacterized protein LOC135368096 [Ornithodoros turicata]|uniref:uncharacterized protein LOC135368096 n=1 Tax=Ornithodoros turicata TaxID=34597 RepID=UPI003138F8F4
MQLRRKNARWLEGEELRDALSQVVESILEHEDAEHFSHPVDERLYPNYSIVVKEPMDLSRIKAKLESCTYTSCEGFVKDIKRMVENCAFYNGFQSELARKGYSLWLATLDILQRVFGTDFGSVSTPEEPLNNRKDYLQTDAKRRRKHKQVPSALDALSTATIKALEDSSDLTYDICRLTGSLEAIGDVSGYFPDLKIGGTHSHSPELVAKYCSQPEGITQQHTNEASTRDDVDNGSRTEDVPLTNTERDDWPSQQTWGHKQDTNIVRCSSAPPQYRRNSPVSQSSLSPTDKDSQLHTNVPPRDNCSECREIEAEITNVLQNVSQVSESSSPYSSKVETRPRNCHEEGPTGVPPELDLCCLDRSGASDYFNEEVSGPLPQLSPSGISSLLPTTGNASLQRMSQLVAEIPVPPTKPFSGGFQRRRQVQDDPHQEQQSFFRPLCCPQYAVVVPSNVLTVDGASLCNFLPDRVFLQPFPSFGQQVSRQTFGNARWLQTVQVQRGISQH